LEVYQADPLREEHLGQTAFVVCRECGWRGKDLHHHIRKTHRIEIAAYEEKWKYAPLVAQDTRDAAGSRKKEWGELHENKYFHTKDGINKHYELEPGQGLTVLRALPPAQQNTLRQRADLKRGKHLRGRSRADRRGQYFDRKSRTWASKPPGDDATIVELRLAGKTYREIGDEVDRTGGAAQKIAKLCGFPPSGSPCSFLHGEPLTKRHFLELCEDFGQSKKAVIKAAGLGYASVMNWLGQLQDQDVLPRKMAGAFFELQHKWIDSYCIKNVAGKDVRDFLTSELRNLPVLQSQLRTGLQAVRAWLRSAGTDVQPTEMLNWICRQARSEVASSRLSASVACEFRTLLFMWPRFKELGQKKPRQLAGQRHIDEVANELLGLDYGAATARIAQAVDGNLTALQPSALAMALRAELRARTVSEIPKIPHKSRKRDDQRKNYQLARAVHELLPKCAEGLQLRRDAQARWPTERTRWESALRQAGFTAQTDVDALISSKTAAGAAQRIVAHRKGLNFRRVRNAYSACKESLS
jgi:hypothetical protein